MEFVEFVAAASEEPPLLTVGETSDLQSRLIAAPAKERLAKLCTSLREREAVVICERED
jgi:hypothetical protein